ncbi:HEAT repeat domain-containing protein [Agrobacterium tumefaciens]|nr:HEAT repeat domain-containing protein [Agrobacterium tumefaciens]NTE25026.1 HEAT repeat domain-containing protein [Agrobacterium tumefaciens]
MNLEELKQLYGKLTQQNDEVKLTEFTWGLAKLNDIDALEFHYSLLKNQENIYLFYGIRGNFDKHGEAGKEFLLKKIFSETDPDLKAEALFILGGMDCAEIKPVAISFLQSENYKEQYYGIIVIGWIGKSEDIAILENVLTNNGNAELRAYAVTALRQIAFSNSRLNKKVASAYARAYQSEADEIVRKTIIVCFQDLIKVKFGLRELQTGEITGDLNQAEPKFKKALINYLG